MPDDISAIYPPQIWRNLGHALSFEEISKNKSQISLSKLFASIVLSEFNQDVTFFVEGARGTGKSYSLLTIAKNTAEHIAKDQGGKWDDWFAPDENIAIIDPDAIYRVIMNLKPYNVYILDDIGVGWNARRFTSSANIMMNDVFEICRTKNAVILMSAPAAFLIDRIPRELVGFVGHMQPPRFDAGYARMKVKKPVRSYYYGKVIYPQITLWGGQKVVEFRINRPPEDLASRYDKLRDEVTSRIMQSHYAAILQELGQASDGFVDKSEYEEAIKKAKFFEAMYTSRVRGEPLEKVCSNLGMTLKEYNYMRKKLDIPAGDGLQKRLDEIPILKDCLRKYDFLVKDIDKSYRAIMADWYRTQYGMPLEEACRRARISRSHYNIYKKNSVDPIEPLKIYERWKEIKSAYDNNVIPPKTEDEDDD